jgi:hypothetical protein
MEIHLCLETLQGYVPLILSGWWSSSSSFWKTSYQTFLMSFWRCTWNRSWKVNHQEKRYRLYAGNFTPTEKSVFVWAYLFSRGSDAEIYQERKNLGRLILPAVLSAIEQDTDNTVFSYSKYGWNFFYGLVEAAQIFKQRKKNYILEKR